MQEFITDGRRSDVKLEADGEDEFSMMARAFNQMSDNIDEYEDDHHNRYEYTSLEVLDRILETGTIKKNDVFVGGNYELWGLGTANPRMVAASTK